jgi:hypothetical protein
MIRHDFLASVSVPKDTYKKLPFYRRLFVRAVYLFSPIA